MIYRTALAALLSTSLLVGPAVAQSAAAPSAPATAAQSAHDRLFNLFKQSDEDNLRRNPIFGGFAACAAGAMVGAENCGRAGA